MLRRIFGGLVALTLALFSSLAISATPALAQAEFRDDAPTNDSTTGNNVAYTAVITVSAPYTVTSIEALTRVTVAHNQKFFIMDASTNAVVYVSPPKAFAADGPQPPTRFLICFPPSPCNPEKPTISARSPISRPSIPFVFQRLRSRKALSQTVLTPAWAATAS